MYLVMTYADEAGSGPRRFDKAEPADVACLAGPRREDDMDWQKPSFEEINMSAEIGAYQGDDDGRDNEPTVAERPPPTARRRPARVRAAPGPRVGRRRRLSAMELRLRRTAAACARERCAPGRAPRSASPSRPTAERWFLLNASPEIRAQLESFPALWPRAPRHSPVAARRAHQRRPRPHARAPLAARVPPDLGVRDRRRARRLPRGQRALPHARALPRPGELAARSSSAREAPLADTGPRSRPRCRSRASCRSTSRRARAPSPEDNVGLRIRDPRGGGVARVPAGGRRASRAESMMRSQGADGVFFDGTFWSSDELIAAEARHAPRRGHGALAGRRRERQPRVPREAPRAGGS